MAARKRPSVGVAAAGIDHGGRPLADDEGEIGDAAQIGRREILERAHADQHPRRHLDQRRRRHLGQGLERKAEGEPGGTRQKSAAPRAAIGLGVSG